MKIGILTFFNANNYGAVLQTYALQQKLRELFPSDEICVVGYENLKIKNTYNILWDSSIKNKAWAIIRLVKNLLTIRNRIKAIYSFNLFRYQFLTIGSDNFSEYDLIFYGSDQIWNPIITSNDYYFLGANFNGKKVAFSASDGGKLLLADDEKELLKSFSSISVREQSLSNLLNENEIKNIVTCDPVFFISKNDWSSIQKIPYQKDYVLAYMIGRNKQFEKQAELLGKLLGKKVLYIMYVRKLQSYFCLKNNIISAISPNEFIGYFANSKAVVTTSFHGTAFSIIYEKPFFVLKLNKYAERITNLLQQLGLQNQYVEEIPEKIAYLDKLYTPDFKERFNNYITKSEIYLKYSYKKII